MSDKDYGKGHLLIAYLFDGDEGVAPDFLKNFANENTMKKELQELAESWKKRGFIKRYMIGDDELINNKLKS